MINLPHLVSALWLQEAAMTDYFNSKNLTEAVSAVREMRAPKHFLPEMLSKIIVCSLDRPDEDKEHASTLIHMLRTEGLITGENFMQVCVSSFHLVSYYGRYSILGLSVWFSAGFFSFFPPLKTCMLGLILLCVPYH